MLDHKSRKDLLWIVLTLSCFFRQLPGECVNNPLQLDPPSIVVRFGDPASVNCNTNVTHHGMGWESSQGGVDMVDGVQSINWNVESIFHWDLKPICYNTAADQCQRVLNITIYKPPDRVSMSFVNHTGPMIEGNEYELQCEVQNVAPVHLLNVNWYKEKQLVHSDNFTEETKTPVNKKMTLQVSPQRGDDGVKYRCEAVLELGPEGPQPPPRNTSNPLNIRVHFGPEFSNCEDDEQLMEGESLVGYCTATGNPLPHYYWKKDMNIVDPNAPLNRNSNGIYNIIINDKIVRSMNVSVKYGPEISCEPNYTVEEGHDFMPNCTVVGFPKPELTWYKDNMDILQIPHKMAKEDAGQYTLQASNGNATVNHILEVEVLYPPLGIVELESAQVSRGKEVYLKCSSKGNPPISYIWTYHQTSNVQVLHQDGVSLLHIKHAREENIGTYKCTAYNSLGENSHMVRVDIQGAKAKCPLWISPQESVFTYTSANMTFTCHSSVPNARLSWEYLNQTYHGSTLDINSTSVVNLPAWKVKASCYGHFVGLDNCTKNISVSMYKRPDNISISPVNHTGPMIEGHNFTLRCDILNVAPIQSLIVNWYEGEVLVKNKRFPTTRNPDNKTLTLNISPRRNSAYTCEAKLDFGSNLTKSYKDYYKAKVYAIPVITTKFPARVPLFRGYPEKLVCEASGFPEPTITWSFNNKTNHGNQTVIDSPGEYTCTASNSYGTVKKKVIVDMKEVSCDLVLMPAELLVEYGDSASANCLTATPSVHTGMGWEASQGAVDMIEDVQLVTWKLDSLVHWDIQPICFLKTSAWQCQTKLPVTVYKLPDRVSVSTAGHRGPMIEGKPYELQCDVYNIAPVHLLTVNWYKGQHLVAKTWFSDSTKTPVNQSTRFQLSLSRADDGIRYRCEAELKLGWVKTSSKMASQVLGLTVHYSPQVTSVVEIFNETSEDGMLNCTVEANPPPSYTWSSSLQKEFNVGHPVLPLSSVGSGNYTCTASNEIGSVSKMFVVRVKPRDGNHTTFWAILGPFVGLAVGMIVGYVLLKTRTRKI